MAYPSPKHQDFFSQGLDQRDPLIADVLRDELRRQQDEIELIASENRFQSHTRSPGKRAYQ